MAQISQLGLVALVYPAANHTRFEHSLGVYRLALLFLRQLVATTSGSRRGVAGRRRAVHRRGAVARPGALAVLPPDRRHALPSVPQHELFANSFLLEGEIADALRHDWRITAARRGDAAFATSRATRRARLLASMLSGPIDIDKMDYLARDSLHAGVPYGRNFDQGRLIGSLCLNARGDGLAITDKGKTAAEMMVFARYVMFSEVYWHHGGARGHGDAAAGVLPGARRRWISTSCFA